ncbi:hypothetical protein LCGC14_0680220 [marine sediment metagenome]|uniref:Uncharacterized protein n=1 Tax=marine sediment metagenome TaxID=412755 RepID=A0A0F9QTA8_9ZZZZ
MAFSLPDFDEMLALSDEIGTQATTLGLLKAELKGLISIITREVMSNQNHWITKTKPPAMNYIETTFHRDGYDEFTSTKLNALRVSISEVDGRLEMLKLKFQVYRYQIDVWKADQYAKRSAQY